MFDDDKVPQNLPTEGKSMLDNINPDTKEPPKPLAAPKPPALPKVSSPASPAPAKPLVVLSEAAEKLSPPLEKIPEPPTPPAAPRPFAPAQDIFEGVKDAAPPLSPKPPVIKDETMMETPKQGFKRIIIAVFSVVVLAGAISAGGYFVYNKFIKSKPLSPNLNVNLVPPAPQNAPEPTPPPAPQPVRIDSDNDGLTDEEESANKTNPLAPDSDGDGLFDAEEINVYKTDPLNPDTDGDTFRDGDEVKNGYDPKGPGKLIRIPAGQ